MDSTAHVPGLSAEEVALWVRLDVGYPQYADTFLEHDVSGAVAAFDRRRYGIGLEDLGLVPDGHLASDQGMVENARTFGHRAIGYQQANVERTERRHGAVWDAGGALTAGHCGGASTEVVWGPDIPTIISKLARKSPVYARLAEPTQWKLPPPRLSCAHMWIFAQQDG